MSLFSYIKERVSILDVIGEYTQLKKAGTYWKGICPFHHEKTPSFTVSPDRGIFYCFGCHQGGDVISFIEKIERFSPIEAVHHLAERYQIALDEFMDKDLQQVSVTHKQKIQYHKLCYIVAQWCHQHLMKHTYALHYLLKRGVSKESMQQFNLGYFPGGIVHIKELVQVANQHNFLVQDLLEQGIISEGKTFFYSPFEERIIFPIKDHLGQYSAFGGRIFRDNDERAKYYNSRENQFFNKGGILFGFDLAKKDIQQANAVFLVEGYTDCIAMVQHGFKNTVATLGTSCTQEHLKILSRYINQVYVLYDGDYAGREAVLRLASMCWQVALELKVLSLPDQEDPASFLARGLDFRELLSKAQDIMLFYSEMVAKNFAHQSLQEKLEAIRKLVGVIALVPDQLAKDILLQRLVTSTGISLSNLKKELGQQEAKQEIKSDNKSPLFTANSPLEEIKNAQKLENKLFFAIMSNIDLFQGDSQDYLIEYLPDPLSALLARLKELKAENSEINFQQFYDTLDNQEKEYVSKVLLSYKLEEMDFSELLYQFHRKNWRSIVQMVKKQLELAKQKGNKIEEERILRNFLELKKRLLTNSPTI